jgi:DNA-binding transcriptional MerR regulator
MMEATIPIRELSRLTGVNSVTIRAWERRYGLIKPLRTNKGHRLYRPEDVELIQTIQAWLARGLAIGKVSELLESGQPRNQIEIENIWQTHCDELLTILAELNMGKFDSFFNQLFSVYPAALVADQLIVPVLETLEQDTFGSSIKKSILINHLSEYLSMLTQRQRQQAMAKRVAIIQLSAATNSLLNVLLLYGLMMNQIKSELIGLASTAEVVFAAEQLKLDGIIIYNDSCSSLSDFQKELSVLAQKISIPIFVAGGLAPAISADLSAQVFIAEDGSQQSVNALLSRVLSENEKDEEQE